MLYLSACKEGRKGNVSSIFSHVEFYVPCLKFLSSSRALAYIRAKNSNSLDLFLARRFFLFILRQVVS